MTERTRGRNRRSVILLDTNALLLPFRERFPLDPELERLGEGREVLVPDSVLRELTGLASGGDPFAPAALDLAARFPRVGTVGAGDEALLDIAQRRRAWVVTGDRALAARLHEAGIVVLAPRGRSRLALRPGGASRSIERGGRRPRKIAPTK